MANRFWVGGSTTWDGTAGTKWATTSGGAGGAAVPTTSDDVFFDAASGAVTVTVGSVTVNCNNLDFTGFTGTLASASAFLSTINIVGTVLKLSTGMTSTYDAQVTPTGSSTLVITCNGKKLCRTLNINTSTVTVQLGDDFYTTNTGSAPGGGYSIKLNQGTFNANNKDLYIQGIQLGAAGTTVLNMGSGTWHFITGTTSFSGNNWSAATSGSITINSNTSTIKFESTTSGENMVFGGGGYTYNNLWFSRGSNTNSNTIQGSNTFNDLKDDGSAAHSLIFTAGTTQTVTTFTVSGTAGNNITINSTTTGTHTLSQSSGTVSSQYLNIQHSIATGGATWNATNSVDNNSVATAGSGWNITAPPVLSSGGAFMGF